jgi:hypothetical protein
MVGMDDWGWEHVARWTEHRVQLPIGPLFCVLVGPTRGRGWSATAAGGELRRLAVQAGVRRRFAPQQLLTNAIVSQECRRRSNAARRVAPSRGRSTPEAVTTRRLLLPVESACEQDGQSCIDEQHLRCNAAIAARAGSGISLNVACVQGIP